MRNPKFLRSGFDAFDVAFRGALSPTTLNELSIAKKHAQKVGEPFLASLGPGYVDGHVLQSGKTGGYAYTFDTGPMGEIWFFKKGLSANDWNIFVSVKALSLAMHGLESTWTRVQASLADLGAMTSEESVNRVDYALDFLVDRISLDPHLIVAHPRTTLRPHYGPAPDEEKPRIVMRGRRVESITIGQMPGRQVILYDKGREVRQSGKLSWFKIWGISQNEQSEILRVEIRAGKNHLKGRWNLASFASTSRSIGDVLCCATAEIRYVDDWDTNRNVTRRRIHPLWESVATIVHNHTLDVQSGLAPSDLLVTEREAAQRRYRALMVGNLVPLCAALGLEDFAEVAQQAPQIAADNVRALIEDDPDRISEALGRAQRRLHFLT